MLEYLFEQSHRMRVYSRLILLASPSLLRSSVKHRHLPVSTLYFNANKTRHTRKYAQKSLSNRFEVKFKIWFWVSVFCFLRSVYLASKHRNKASPQQANEYKCILREKGVVTHVLIYNAMSKAMTIPTYFTQIFGQLCFWKYLRYLKYYRGLKKKD